MHALLWPLWLLPPAAAQATYPSEFRMDWCVGEHCFDHSISAAQFQMRLRDYYQELTCLRFSLDLFILFIIFIISRIYRF